MVLGAHNLEAEDGSEQVFNVSKIISNPTYNPKTYNGDLMLLKVSRAIYSKSFIFSSLIQKG